MYSLIRHFNTSDRCKHVDISPTNEDLNFVWDSNSTRFNVFITYLKYSWQICMIR